MKQRSKWRKALVSLKTQDRYSLHSTGILDSGYKWFKFFFVIIFLHWHNTIFSWNFTLFLYTLKGWLSTALKVLEKKDYKYHFVTSGLLYFPNRTVCFFSNFMVSNFDFISHPLSSFIEVYWDCIGVLKRSDKDQFNVKNNFLSKNWDGKFESLEVKYYSNWQLFNMTQGNLISKTGMPIILSARSLLTAVTHEEVWNPMWSMRTLDLIQATYLRS